LAFLWTWNGRREAQIELRVVKSKLAGEELAMEKNQEEARGLIKAYMVEKDRANGYFGGGK